MILRFVCALVLLAAWPLGVQAQVLHILEPKGVTPSPALEVLHVTDWLSERPEAKRARATYKALKAQGGLPYNASKSAYSLGARATFKVYNFRSNDFDEIDFELKREEDDYLIWVEVDELNNGHVSDADLNGLTQALSQQTPAASFDPNAGIIANDEAVFGTPPDVDGDGKTDILVVDVRDSYDPQNNQTAAILGFVSPTDLTDEGNARDILYLDSWPGLASGGVTGISQTAAHEYQHLIHLAYDDDEASLVNEGLSEWAEVMNGYTGRRITYLSDPERYNVKLLRWSGNSSRSVFDDYQRGGLFTSYVAERLGTLGTGSITREAGYGATGYRNVFANHNADFTLEDLLMDFHIANFVNDQDLQPNYGYATPQYQGLRAAPTFLYDGRSANVTSETEHILREGAAQYLVWDHVQELTMHFDVLRFKESVEVVALLFQDGGFEVRPLDLTQTSFFFPGMYDRIVVVAVHVKPDGINADYVFSADWLKPGETAFVETVRYDNGQFVAGKFFKPSAPANTLIATRFAVPRAERGTALERVFVAPLYANQFGSGSASDPRDITLYVWENDGNGAPGEVLFSAVFEDARAFSALPQTIDFWEIDLSALGAALPVLPDTVFVGYGGAGTDANDVMGGVSTYSEEDVSFLGNSQTGSWTPLWALSLLDDEGNELALSQNVFPIRALFVTPISTDVEEEVGELPAEVVLHTNYPNPFNPSTTIRYSIPRTTTVKITVLDLLGREVVTLVDGVQTSGEHQLQVDASQWASGMYLYTLEAEGQRQTRRMLLLR